MRVTKTPPERLRLGSMTLSDSKQYAEDKCVSDHAPVELSLQGQAVQKPEDAHGNDDGGHDDSHSSLEKQGNVAHQNGPLNHSKVFQ